MVQIEGDVREKVKSLLKELFQFDMQDLDFGIPRIMNFKRKEIEKFIEEDLIKAAEERFKEYALVGMADLRKEVEKLRDEITRDFGEGTIDGQGNVKKHEDTPKIEEYLNKLKALGDAELTQAQIDDVFNHIYEFFSRYYDKGDFISKRRYGGREKYFVPYNGEEVLFHWANKDQYYVKSGEYFRKYNFKAGGYKVNFLLREAEAELNNVKGETRYFLLCDEEAFKLDEQTKELDIFFNWRALPDDEKKRYGGRNVQEAIISSVINGLLSEVGDKGLGNELGKKTDEEKSLLEKHLKRYVGKNTTDYFVHKNLKSFLEGELDFYIKSEVLDIDEIEGMDERRMCLNKAKMHAIRQIGIKVIEFLAQIEDFQKMLFEKKKLILRTEYVITLDKIKEHAGDDFLKSVLDEVMNNPKQLEEWKGLLRLSVKNEKDFAERRTINRDELKKLPIDTKHFDPDFKTRLVEKLSEKNELDSLLDGVLIKGENLQALSLLLDRYQKQVKCIYIDPPYNTGSDEFVYKDRYQHSSWLSMMADRLRLAKEYLRDDGAIFVNINDIENSSLMALMRTIFGGELEMPTFVWRKKGTSTNVTGAQVSSLTDFLIAFGGADSINPRITLKEKRKYPHQDIEGRYRTTIIEKKHAGAYARETMTFEILGSKPRPGKRWQIGKEKAEELEKKGRFILEGGIVKLKIYDFEDHDTLSANPNLLLSHGSTNTASQLLTDLFGKPEIFSNPKPVELISHLVSISTNREESIVLDFFAGSGTTAQAVMELNLQEGGRRKYFLIEADDCFDSIILPRVKKLMFSKNWKDGLPASNEGISQMLKYISLEEYEDTLNNIVFREKDKTIQETLDSFQDYFLRYMLDYETRDSPTRLATQKFQTPFDYKIKTINGTEEKEQNVDLVETFNYLLGLNVSKIRTFSDDQRIYHVVYGKRNNKSTVIIWRNTKDLDLQKDKGFIEEKVLSGNTYGLIFVNGDSYVRNATAIEPEFKKLMGA